MPQAPKNLRDIQSLVEIVATLRGPEGCPWDKEQSHRSLAPYAVEEVAELVEAIESQNDDRTRDELGDVLFQVLLHAQLAQERGAFGFEDVVENLNRKMVRRHPHVFSETKVSSSAEVIANWDQIKKNEKLAEASSAVTSKTLDVPVPLPALQRAAKIGSRTRKLKFDWPTTEGVMEKVREEMAELEEAFEDDRIEPLMHEIGDVLFSLAQLCRHLERDPEQVLRDANRRFERRFESMIDQCRRGGLDWDQLADAEKEELWKKAKGEVG